MTELTPDFGFISPRTTLTKCPNPAFANHHLHRVGVFKDFHIGSPGDCDENGLPGWVCKFICVQCNLEFKDRVFMSDADLKGEKNVNQKIQM